MCARNSSDNQQRRFAAMYRYQYILSVESTHHFHQYSMNRKRKKQRRRTQITVYIERHSIIVFDLSTAGHQLWWWRRRCEMEWNCGGEREIKIWPEYEQIIFITFVNFLFKSRGYRTPFLFA